MRPGRVPADLLRGPPRPPRRRPSDAVARMRAVSEHPRHRCVTALPQNAPPDVDRGRPPPEHRGGDRPGPDAGPPHRGRRQGRRAPAVRSGCPKPGAIYLIARAPARAQLFPSLHTMRWRPAGVALGAQLPTRVPGHPSLSRVRL